MKLFQHIKQSFTGAPLFLVMVGMIFFGVGVGLTYHQVFFRMNALQAPGEVANFFPASWGSVMRMKNVIL